MSTIERLRETTIHAAGRDSAAQAELGEFGTLVNGLWLRTGDAIEVLNPYDQSLVAIVHRAGPPEIETAIAIAAKIFPTTRKLPAWKRADILERISAGIAARSEEFARIIALEAGKPIKAARIEVERAAFTFKVAAEEAKRIYGEIVPLDWRPGTEGRVGHIQRVALGPVLGITPFNWPLMLLAHKVAPALAVGNPIIIRPASQTPVSALKLGELILEAGWPEGGYAVVPTTTQVAALLVEDDRIRKLSFTGSPAVGWDLKRRAGRKRVTLELGGNAGVIVHADADIPYAAERVAWGGFSYAGQSCISVQRVYAHDSVYDTFLADFLPRVQALKVGNPLDEATDVGPLIDRASADRLETWVTEARNGGAEVLVGGERNGNLWQPTVLGSLRDDMRVVCQEVFAPLVGMFRYSDATQAIRAVDTGDFGLQAGLFTNDLNLVHTAFEELEVGGLIINDVSTFRVDHMPYGGVKQSGFGREGLRYAIEEMTEIKLLAFNYRGR